MKDSQMVPYSSITASGMTPIDRPIKKIEHISSVRNRSCIFLVRGRHFPNPRFLLVVIIIIRLNNRLLNEVLGPVTIKKAKSVIHPQLIYNPNSPIRLFPPLFLITNNIHNLPLKLIITILDRIEINKNIRSTLHPNRRPKARRQLDKNRFLGR